MCADVILKYFPLLIWAYPAKGVTTLINAESAWASEKNLYIYAMRAKKTLFSSDDTTSFSLAQADLVSVNVVNPICYQNHLNSGFGFQLYSSRNKKELNIILNILDENFKSVFPWYCSTFMHVTPSIKWYKINRHKCSFHNFENSKKNFLHDKNRIVPNVKTYEYWFFIGPSIIYKFLVIIKAYRIYFLN